VSLTPEQRRALARLSPEVRRAVADLARAARARGSLEAWCERGPPTRRGPYRFAPWSRHLARELEAVSEATIRREAPRLIVTAPPQHGKSEIVARRWPLWHLARTGHTVALGSYAASLSVEHSRATREMSTWEPYRETFDTLRRVDVDRSDGYRRADVDQVDNWRVGGGGRYMAVGVGGGLTGRDPNLIIIDDPFKDASEAYSPARREAVWSWFSGVILTRALANGSGIVVMHTRWHEDDLVGRLLREQPGRWRVLNYRLEAEEDDILGRALGEPLDPAIMGPDQIADMHRTMIPRDVSALYQQRPVPAGGAMIQAEWLGVRYDMAPEAVRLTCDRVVMGVDLAFTGRETSDYCVAVVLGVRGAQRYVLDVVRQRLSYPAQRAMVAEVARRWRPEAVVVELAANGDALVSELSPVVPGLRGERAARDKAQRLADSGTLAAMHAGQVVFPRAAEWMPAFELEALSFTGSGSASGHDDQVDALVWAMVAARAPASSGYTWDDIAGAW
jgi:predicted phage terminase large subunit-like protein